MWRIERIGCCLLFSCFGPLHGGAVCEKIIMSRDKGSPSEAVDGVGLGFEPSGKEMDSGRSLLDALICLARHKRVVFGVTLAGTAAALLLALLLPKTFSATAVILPPQQPASLASQLLGQLGALGVSAAGTGSLLKNPGDMYVGMLKSRSIAEHIVSEFDLKAVYKSKLVDDACRKLAQRSHFASGMDSLIKVTVEDRNPQRAAAIANSYVKRLHGLISQLALTEAAQQRMFFEKQVEKERLELARAETNLKRAIQRTGIIQHDDQTKAVVQAIGDLRAQVILRETTLNGLKAGATDDNPAVIRLRSELASLRDELNRMQGAKGSGGGKAGLDPFLPVGSVPEASLDYLRALREFRYHETLCELLIQQLEIARLEEAKESSLIKVVDKAAPPQRKSGPPRVLIVFMGASLSFAAGVAGAFMLEANRNRSDRWRIFLKALTAGVANRQPPPSA